ncbi:peptidase domain-containing ABC transporter [bacterium]|nr:peptidase domain-containing ABC transporter [bacterium]
MKKYGQLWRFSKLIRPYWGNIVQSIVLGIIITILSLPIPWFTKILIDTVYPESNVDLLYFILLTLLLFSVVQALFNFLRNYFMYSLGLKMWTELQFKFFKHLLKLSFNFFDSRKVGEVMSRFQDAGESLYRIMDIINRVIMSTLSIIIFPVIIFLINWKLALIAICLIPVDALVFFYTNKYIHKFSKKAVEAGAELSAKNFETLSGIRTVQSLKIEKQITGKIKSLYSEMLNARLKTGLLQNGSQMALGVIRAVTRFLYMWFGWVQILNGDLTLGKYLAFTMFIGYLYDPLRQLVTLSQDIQITLIHTGRFFEFYDIKPKIHDTSEAKELPENIKGDIVFKDVNFSYEKGQAILKNINMNIPQGNTVALVGKSGVGKSTIACLIQRFYDPDSGSIHIDEYDIKKVKVESLRSKMGTVMQDPFLFYGTILDNITLERGAIDMQRVKKAAEMAYADTFIEAFPKGYDTIIGERGLRLSQGQKQRITIARILYVNPSILIIDEGTSSLDLESEQYIQSALKKIRKGRTTVVIAHRLSTIKDADIIFVIDEGTIKEKGTHEELMADSVVYRNLYDRLTVI